MSVWDTSNRVYVWRQRLSKENWDWLRGKVGVPDDGRMFIILMEPSDLLTELHARHAGLNIITQAKDPVVYEREILGTWKQ